MLKHRESLENSDVENAVWKLQPLICFTHFFQKTGIVHHTNLNDLIHTPAHACEHALRFIGEGLNNVARHAHAHQVSVEAKRVETWLVITMQDDGQGFDPTNRTLSTGHYGLLGLQERAHLVEGTVSVNSSEGKGTTLEFRVPLTPSGSFDPPHMGATPCRKCAFCLPDFIRFLRGCSV